MNIYQKLIEVRKAVPYLKKDTKGYQFNFVSSSQTLGSLRDKMDKMGLVLVPSITDTEVRDHTTKKGDHEYFTMLTMHFTWVNADNPEETVHCPWEGHGLDSGEKGVGKAVTYAEKYFLLKFFNIPTDKDDPDSFQKKQAPTVKPEPKKEAPKQENRKAVDSWLTWIDNFSKGNSTSSQFLSVCAEHLEPVMAKFTDKHRNEILIAKKEMITNLTDKESK